LRAAPNRRKAAGHGVLKGACVVVDPDELRDVAARIVSIRDVDVARETLVRGVAGAAWRLDWSALNKEGNIAASKRTPVLADFDLMRAVLDPVVVRR
jgi:hypothetical protein